jgi:hypothetical protein
MTIRNSTSPPEESGLAQENPTASKFTSNLRDSALHCLRLEFDNWESVKKEIMGRQDKIRDEMDKITIRINDLNDSFKYMKDLQTFGETNECLSEATRNQMRALQSNLLEGNLPADCYIIASEFYDSEYEAHTQRSESARQVVESTEGPLLELSKEIQQEVLALEFKQLEEMEVKAELDAARQVRSDWLHEMNVTAFGE